MGIKSHLAKIYASVLVGKLKKAVSSPIEEQQKVFHQLISGAQESDFGRDHQFDQIKTYADFKQMVPVRDYEDLKDYIDNVVDGGANVLWKGKPIYLCKTSGTTSGAKYIPITKASISNHIDSAKLALLSYIHHSGNSAFVDGKMIFLQGSPKLEDKNGVQLGRLSGIVAHHVPSYLQKNRVPSFETNCIEDWETKVDAIVEETHNIDLRLISGIPSWVQMYFERLLAKTGKKTVMEIFPNFSLFVYGGVNYEPYRPIFKKLIGRDVDSVETYPASEGFIAFQDTLSIKNGLLLVINSGIFYEFIPVSEFHNEQPSRLCLAEVEIDVNYCIILNTNAGLWGYNIGDTVKFVSTDPYRIVVTGRIKHFTSAFGEHVIAEEVEKSMQIAMEKFNISVREFHVAPQITPPNGLPYHEWFIEFEKKPNNLMAFATELDKQMQGFNPYYQDLLEGKVLKQLQITCIDEGGFVALMKAKGKLGGQNKVPRLANDRTVARELENIIPPADTTGK